MTRAKTRGSRPDSPCRPRRAGGRLRAAGIALIAATPLVAQALPEDALLAGISGDFRQPQLRCEWIASRFDSIAEQLSLYREELGAFVVTVDGVTIGDSTNGAVLSVEFESRRSGPGSAMLALADRATVDAMLEAAFQRLAQPAGQTPERRFLQDYARAHRPTLLHLYRLRPDGARALDAIGR